MNTKSFLAVLPEELHRELKMYSVKLGKSMNELIVLALEEFLWENVEG